MKYKLLALDLDDTLLGDNLDISPRNKRAIQEVVLRGMLVTIATGRMFRSALPYAQDLEVDLPLITYHGALIKRVKGEVFKHCPVPLQLAAEILKLAEDEGLHINFYLDDKLYIRESNENAEYYRSISSIPFEEVGSLYLFLLKKGREPTKLTVIDKDQEKLARLQKRIRKVYSPELSILQSRPRFLEITHKEATKGQALKYLAEREGISPAEIIAIGDNYNDLDMLQFAGLGVAVANAPPEIKASADLITRANTEDGVAFFIEEHLLRY